MNNRPYPSAEARQAVLGHIIEVVKTRLPQEIRAMLLCFTRDLRLFVLPAGDMMSPDLKPRFVRTVQELVKEHDIALTCFVSEAWAAPPVVAPGTATADEVLESMPAPSEHPDRQEVLIVTIQTVGGFDQYVYELKDRQLVEPGEHLSTYEQHAGHLETVFDFFALVRPRDTAIPA